MSTENEGLSSSWDEIKAAARRTILRERPDKREKRMVREYLAHTECEDARIEEEHVVIPGYN